MLAVIKVSGLQHLVKKDDVIKVSKLDSQVGDIIDIKEVLSTMNNGDVNIGSPYLENTVVKAEVLSQTKDKKVLVFKKKRRKHHRKKNGHRQHITVLRIVEIK